MFSIAGTKGYQPDNAVALFQGLKNTLTWTFEAAKMFLSVFIPQTEASSDEHCPCKAFHWGGDWKASSSLSLPHTSPLLVKLQTKMIVASDKDLAILSADGAVYKLSPESRGEYTHTVSGRGHCGSV